MLTELLYLREKIMKAVEALLHDIAANGGLTIEARDDQEDVTTVGAVALLHSALWEELIEKARKRGYCVKGNYIWLPRTSGK